MFYCKMNSWRLKVTEIISCVCCLHCNAFGFVLSAPDFILTISAAVPFNKLRKYWQLSVTCRRSSVWKRTKF